jgi:hypothetical protein
MYLMEGEQGPLPYEGGDKVEDRQFPALVKAGWTRHQEKCREAP